MHSKAVLIVAPLALAACLFAVSVSAFPEGVVRQRAKFNYSSRPSATLQQSINERVPEFALAEENDEESTTRSPLEASFGYQFSEVSSGLDKKSEGSESRKPVTPVKPDSKNPEGEDEESAEDNDSRRRSLGRKEPVPVRPVSPIVEDDEPPKPKVVLPPAPFGVHFYEVSSKLNEKKPVEEPEPVEEEKKVEAEKKKEEESNEEDDVSDEKKEKEVKEVVKEKEADVEDSDNADTDVDSESKDSRRGGRQFANQFSNLRQNVGCGYYRMRNGNVISFQSNNFNFSEYRNNDLCSWRFFGQQCILRASCPCFDVPPSADCKEDQLKFTDGYSFYQKFCGQNRPQGSYKSTTNNLNIWFKTNWQDTATGFFCYVTCTGPGQREPATPPVTCPTPLFPGPPGPSTSSTPVTINPSSIGPTDTGEVGIPGVTAPTRGK